MEKHRDWKQRAIFGASPSSACLLCATAGSCAQSKVSEESRSHNSSAQGSAHVRFVMSFAGARFPHFVGPVQSERRPSVSAYGCRIFVYLSSSRCLCSAKIIRAFVVWRAPKVGSLLEFLQFFDISEGSNKVPARTVELVPDADVYIDEVSVNICPT